LFDLSILFIVIDCVAAHIFFKGDCVPIEDLDNRNDSPDWSPCMAFRNCTFRGCTACGEDLPNSPVEIYEYREFGLMNWVSKHVNSLSPCNVNCGEGFQYRNITSSESCTAIQYRSCWVGKCLTKNQCLNLIQRSQKEYLTRQYSVNKYCSHWLSMEFIYEQTTNETWFIEYEEIEKLEEKSQIDDEGGCKQNVTDSCKWAYRDFLRLRVDIIENEDLKNCYYQTIENRFYSRSGNNFLSLINAKYKRYNPGIEIRSLFDRANKSCKFF